MPPNGGKITVCWWAADTIVMVLVNAQSKHLVNCSRQARIIIITIIIRQELTLKTCSECCGRFDMAAMLMIIDIDSMLCPSSFPWRFH